MMILVTGDSSSGKSAFAEDLAVKASGDQRVYLATMIGGDAESIGRIKRHRENRNGKNFITIECPVDIIKTQIPEGAVVLLECMSNLVANELFRDDILQDEMHSGAYGRVADSAHDRIIAGINHIEEKASKFVVVTDEVFGDAKCFEEGTESYRKLLGGLNQELSEESDEVYEVICGIPAKLK